MGKIDYDYRIQPDRAIYIVGDFDESLLKEVIPRITELRHGKDKPISIIISSYGGSTDCLRTIIGALSVRGPDGSSSRVITFVPGHAASAGATLLTLGDYAIAAPDSWLHFHGIRTSTDEAIRMEDASQIADRLAKDNRALASHLSEVMIGRLMHRFTRLKPRIDKLEPSKRKESLVEQYILLASEKTSAAADRVLTRALRNLASARELAKVVAKINFPKDEPDGAKDIRILRKIISEHKKRSNDSAWRIRESNLSAIFSDFFLLRDYQLKKNAELLHRLIAIYGAEFLSKADLKATKKIKSQKKRTAFLQQKVAEPIREFWYFSNALAHQLLYGENRITATDAYWIGAVDEIQGDPSHYGLRALVEKAN